VKDARLIKTGEIMGKTHDFGKYTEFFQEKITKKSKRYNRELTAHAPLSSLLSAWVVDKKVGDPFLTAASFLCVYKHHGGLNWSFNDLSQNVKDLCENFVKDPNYRKQISSIKKCLNEISEEMKVLGINEVKEFVEGVDNGVVSKQIWRRIMDVKYGTQPKEEELWRRYFSTLTLFSCLIDSDKMEAAELKLEKRPLNRLTEDMVDRYRELKFPKPKYVIDNLRREIYRNVMKSLSDILNGKKIPRIMTITAPTGSGKTLTGLSVALKLREAIQKRSGTTPRIIYSLPFINIIEQNHSVFEDVLKEVDELSKIPLSLLIKHHHLYCPQERSDLPVEDALMLVESWNSEIVVTTFVQLFQTLVGTRNNMLKKYHNIANSVIILDEVQSIPIEYWRLTREVFDNLTEFFNCHVIFMTATQPIIFSNAKELVSNYEEYYKSLNRTSFQYFGDGTRVEDAVALFLEKFGEGEVEKKSALMVLNTIGASLLAYKSIKMSLGSRVIGLRTEEDEERLKDKIVLTYLSTNIVPKERGRRINLINKLIEEGRRVIVVSTQVIEAGVDLDFDMVMRDIGPFDSINQVAGRCNRRWRNAKGEVYVVRLVDENDVLYSTRIYGNLLIRDVTEDLLIRNPRFEERDILSISKSYFDRAYYVMGAERSDESLDIIEGIKDLDFPKVSEFSLIKEEPKISVFIEIDNEAKNILESFRKILDDLKKKRRGGDLKEIFKCRSKLKEVRTKLEGYVVNVREQNELPSEVIESRMDIRYARRSEVEKFYDEEVGYKRKGIHPAFW